jgi:AcrR family transcriptional regulator
MASPASVDVLPRPPQQARSLRTRRVLLDSTLACLAERGFAGTSTTDVCRHAGVSQGSLFKHFGSKKALFAAAAEHLFLELVDDYRAAFERMADASDRVGAAVRLLWKTFTRPRLQVAFELYVAARTDAELHEALEPVLRAHRSNIRDQAAALFPEAAAAHPDFDGLVDLILDAMQGAALGRMVLADEAVLERELQRLEALARRDLE